jgi:Domain of unknown function (DUF4062)
VSSTFEDLREERTLVQKSLLELNCVPVGMEGFPAADDTTWEFIKREIDSCDYYIVLIGGRYGSIHPRNNISFTEMEYDYAQKAEKPSLGFIADPKTILLEKTDKDPEAVPKLAGFIQKVRLKPIRFFSNPHELAGQVATSMKHLIDSKPAVGFVRADTAMAHIAMRMQPEKYKLEFTYPVHGQYLSYTRDNEGAQEVRVDAKGKIDILPEPGYAVWVIRIFGLKGYFPEGEAMLDEKQKSWLAPKTLVGHFENLPELGVCIVGPEGQQLFDYFREANSVNWDLVKAFRTETGRPWTGRGMPLISYYTKDTFLCQKIKLLPGD